MSRQRDKKAQAEWLLEILERKGGRGNNGKDKPAINSDRVHVARLLKKDAIKLQRITDAGSIKGSTKNYRGHTWIVRSPYEIDRVLSLLEEIEEGAAYVRSLGNNVGSKRRRRRATPAV